MMLSRKKSFWFSLITVVLIFAMASYFVGARFFANAAVAPKMRTVVLQKGQTDYQSILDGFENAELTVEDNVADFVGYQTIDASLFKTIDKLSMADAEAVIGGNIA